MPNSPEAEHLQRAVDAVRDALLPQKKAEPIAERKEHEYESDETQDEGEK